MKIKSIYIQNYKVLNDFKIDFCHNSIVNPITVICGINGSGKTTLLEFINDVFKKAISRSTVYNKLWYNKKDKALRVEQHNNFDISVMDITTNYSLITIFRFLKDGHRTNCKTTKEIFY